MLLNQKGEVVNPDKLPKRGREREAALALLREVREVPKPSHHLFRVDKRAKVKQ